MLSRGNIRGSVANDATITISHINGGALKSAPAEVDSLLSLISLLKKMESFPILPPDVKHHPFICQMDISKSIEVSRQDNSNDTPVIVRFADLDDLCWIAQQGFEEAKSAVITDKRRRVSASSTTPEPLIST